MNKAFTLVELAIVIVIIGLLVGGVLQGQELIRQSALTRIITDFNSYKTATITFRDKYGKLPGDFNRAESIWGSDSGCPNTTYNTTPKKETCNGDGNNAIGSGGGGMESTRYWQHLANANLIKGLYTGVIGGGANPANIAGINVPRGPVDSTGFSMASWGNCTGAESICSYLFLGNYDNSITFGYASNTQYATNALTPQEALQIDTKMDDGKPGTGYITPLGNLNNCQDGSSATSATAQYRVNINDRVCGIIARQWF